VAVGYRNARSAPTDAGGRRGRTGDGRAGLPPGQWRGRQMAARPSR